ncbi:MAG TPA: alpha-amylase family glycosyl hydrolase [Pirellulales bacterium]|nr:alpha-amylase family glycosyl hydrolase [Pirellulales bacterium]
MPLSPRFPSLYQINTRVWLREISRNPKRSATFDDINDALLDSLVFLGFDWLWPLGVWQTGDAARNVSRNHPDWVAGFKRALPDLKDEDIRGSPFAIKSYTVHKDFGGDEALARFRERLKKRGIKLLLDFVPNHTAPDHPWVFEHPEYYIGGNEDDLAREPQNYNRAETRSGSRIFAYGRDPYFPGWPDTFQVNYRSLTFRHAMLDEIEKIAGHCDGIRCDIAMLVLPDVIHRTWGEKSKPADGSPPIDVSFWPQAVARVRSLHPNFVFMGEVYWDREYGLQQQGFDYTYDKRLYDRLHAQHTDEVRGHLRADSEFQRKSVRFLENHDEPRAAEVFPPSIHRAAAIIAFLVPGMRFFHEGQLDGRKQHVSMHLSRRPVEALDVEIRAFYLQLLSLLKSPIVRDGTWQLLDCHPAWDGNGTNAQFISFAWRGADGKRMLVAVNDGPSQAQCRAPLAWDEIADKKVVLHDRLSSAIHERDGNELRQQGLYLDLPAWGYNVFEVQRH